MEMRLYRLVILMIDRAYVKVAFKTFETGLNPSDYIVIGSDLLLTMPGQ